jgi:hypothetical protein
VKKSVYLNAMAAGLALAAMPREVQGHQVAFLDDDLDSVLKPEPLQPHRETYPEMRDRRIREIAQTPDAAEEALTAAEAKRERKRQKLLARSK